MIVNDFIKNSQIYFDWLPLCDVREKHWGKTNNCGSRICGGWGSSDSEGSEKYNSCYQVLDNQLLNCDVNNL